MWWCNFHEGGEGGLTPRYEVRGWSTAQMNIIPCQLRPGVSNLSVQRLSPANCLKVPNFALFLRPALPSEVKSSSYWEERQASMGAPSVKGDYSVVQTLQGWVFVVKQSL